MRNILIFLVALLVISITVISVYLTPDNLRQCPEQPTGEGDCRSADAIVAISGGNTSVRTEEAIRLYQAGWADTLIFSGAAADTTGPSNAEVMRTQAIEAGVPSEAIIIESDAQTTKQNAEMIQETLSSADSDIQRVILVTSPYHQRRASLEFRALAGDGITVLNHPTTNDPDWSMVWWLTPRGWWLAIGELVKIGAFYAGESR